MAPRWLSASVFLLALSALVPAWSFAQKSDLENELKNLPKVPGTPAPPNMGSGPTRLNPLGPYLQKFTGVQFPERVGGFERRGVPSCPRAPGPGWSGTEHIPAPDGSTALFAEYAIRNFGGKKGAVGVRSRLYLFGSDGWVLKFRVTYPEWRAREAATETESFIRTFGTGVTRGKLGV